MPLLNIKNLQVQFGTFPAVDGVDLTLEAGELLGIVGESGSGKSVTMLALMGLIDAPGRVTADAIEFQGRDLLKLSPRERRALIGRDVTGKDAEAALGAAHITVNKNAVPGDPRSPFVTSGLRIGTPAVTTRGYKEPECVALANWICDVLDAPTDDRVIAGVRDNVTKQCRAFPVYG